ncbi:sentrin-specific protease 8-like [Styela clava]|uniref:sentrin-specific protease 8-like n=1 Tax=Styela clava TaxID=7725 RepID=UPI00193A8E71|nr:sentrin-specific protease 8-like [Styela clava]
MDEIILSFGDSLLYTSDLLLLNDSQWLNDKIIGFVYEYFEVEQFKNSKDIVAFMNPSVVQLLKTLTTEEASAIIGPHNFTSKKLAFIPLNDNNTLYPGGIHWSLIICDFSSKCFFHFDSLSNSSTCFNRQPANQLCKQFAALFDFPSVTITQMQCPKQTNGNDCGMYVIAITECLFEYYLKNESFQNGSILDNVCASYIKKKRAHWKKLIQQLAEQHASS